MTVNGDGPSLHIGDGLPVYGATRSSKGPRGCTRGRNPAPVTERGAFPSIGRVPDHSEDMLVVLAGGAAEIGVELLGAEGGIGQAQ
jgi:hypothetical protein